MPSPRAKKSTIPEMDARINCVYDFLLKGLSKTQIQRYAAEEWSVAERTVETYIQRARDLQRLDAELERPQWLAQAVAKLQELERRASENGNYFAAMRAIELQAKLLRFEMS